MTATKLPTSAIFLGSPCWKATGATIKLTLAEDQVTEQLSTITWNASDAPARLHLSVTAGLDCLPYKIQCNNL